MTNLNDYLQQRLSLAESKHQLRSLPTPTAASEAGPYVWLDGQKLVNFSSNDYLGLSHHPDVIQAANKATETYGTGARSSRLIGGHCPQINALETALADYRHTEAALVFSSGYAANIGTISALMNPNDLIIADKLSHACLLDGAKLSGASLQRFRHNDVEHLEKILLLQRQEFANCLIVTESIFSMDGDLAPIENIIKLAKHYNCWLMVDDAHGFGFSSELLKPVSTFENGIISGTLSKAAGALGGYVAGSQTLKDFLVNHARSFIFSTALPPATIAAALTAAELVSNQPTLADTAQSHATLFTQLMDLPPATSTIIPYMIGENDAAVEATKTLAKQGFYVQAIRPPTVPPGTARLRITVSAAHSEDDIRKLAESLKQL